MDLNTYQKLIEKFDQYPTDPERRLVSLTLGIVDESGEVAGKVKKYLRGDTQLSQTKELLIAEIGDVLWYLSRLSSFLGITLEELATINYNKLEDRLNRGVIKGNGDNR